MDLKFSWDEKKNNINQKKHKVAFEEAQTAFLDERARVIPDPDHSESEDRFILLGVSFKINLLVVCHSYLEKLGIIRIFSARKATKKERNKYFEGE